MKTCNKCGRELKDHIKFCIYCGNKLSEKEQNTGSNGEKSQSLSQSSTYNKEELKNIEREASKQTETRSSTEIQQQEPTAGVDYEDEDVQRQVEQGSTQNPLGEGKKVTQQPMQRLVTDSPRGDEDVKDLKQLDERERFDLRLKPKLSRLKDLLNSLNRRSDYSKADYKHIKEAIDEIKELQQEKYYEDSTLKRQTEKLIKETQPISIEILTYLTSHINDHDLNMLKAKWNKIKKEKQEEEETLGYIKDLEKESEELDKLIKQFNEEIQPVDNEQINRSIFFAHYGDLSSFVETDLIPKIDSYHELARKSEQDDLIRQEMAALTELKERLKDTKPGERKPKFSTDELKRHAGRYLRAREGNKKILKSLHESLEDDYKRTKEKFFELRGKYIEQMWNSLQSSVSAEQQIKNPQMNKRDTSSNLVKSSYSSNVRDLSQYSRWDDLDQLDDAESDTLPELQEFDELQELEDFK